MIKRIFSMALVLCMCLCLMPASVFAADTQNITAVNINMQFPVCGEVVTENGNLKDGFKPTVASDANYILGPNSNSGYFNIDIKEDGSLTPGKIYVAAFYLQPKSGYVFPGFDPINDDYDINKFQDISVTIGGKTLDKTQYTTEYSLQPGQYTIYVHEIKGQDYLNVRYAYVLEDTSHTHQWASKWTTDESDHWHECLAENCTVTENKYKDAYGAHEYDNAADESCNVCGYKRTIDKTMFTVNQYGWMEPTAYCLTLEHVTIPNKIGDMTYENGKLKGLNSYAFDNDTCLKTVTIENGLPILRLGTFGRCKNLQSITIPSSVQIIEENVFNGSGITVITLEEGVGKVSYVAFHGMPELTTANIPASVRFTNELPVKDSGLFAGCPKIKTINYAGTQEQWDAVVKGYDNVIKAKNITVNCNAATPPAESKATVTFKVVNGTWDGENSADKTVEVALTDGKGTLPAAQVPTGMKANSGYEGGEWDVTPNTTTDGITGNVTYTYSFTSHTHTMEYHAEVSATCDKNGTKEHWHCTGCKKNFADKDGKTKITDLTIPKGHAWGAPIITFSKDGKSATALVTCQKDAAHTQTPNINISSAITTPATCSVKGTTDYTATVEFEGSTYTSTVSKQDVAINPANHSNLKKVKEKPATCTENGTKEHWYCSACNKNFADAAGKKGITDPNELKIAATGHAYEWIIDKEATETTEGVKHQHCTVCGYNAASVTIPVIKVPVGTVEKVETKPMNTVPEGLKDTEFNTVDKIQQAMEKVVLTKIGEQNTGNEQKTTIYDATLMITENGVTRPATKEEVEARGGITVTIPYPAGTNKADFVFTVAHMLTMDMAGMKAGDIETPEITLTDAGLQVTLKGLSPVMVGYSKKAATSAPTEPTTPGATAPTTPATTKPNPSTGVNIPQTGDESNILLWTLLGIVSACGMIRIVLVKKKRSSIK